MSAPLITAQLHGETIVRDRVLEWKDRRITAAARKLGVQAPSSGDVATRREALLQAKLGLGSDQISARLKNNTRLAACGAGGSKGEQATATLRHRYSGRRRYRQRFVEAFEGWSDTSDEEAMLRACPDHFVIRTRTDGRQEVLETTGGSPLPSLFLIDYDDVSSLVTHADPQFPYQIAGVARTSDGVAIGGVRHQFRDTDEGFTPA